MIKKIFFIFIFIFFINQSNAEENIMILKLKDGNVIIELYSDIAPNHVKRFKQLVKEKKYDGVVFHRVIEGFMAQTGDVQFGNSNLESYDLKRAGTGSSEYPDLKAEFSDIPHERQYTVFGKVIEGMEFVDLIKKGDGPNGSVSKPDKIISLLSK